MPPSPKQNQPVSIGLLWHSPNSDNLGIGALTASNISIIEKVASEHGLSVQFKLIGWRDPGNLYIEAHNIEYCPIRVRHLLHPNGLFGIIRKCDVVLDISAGDSFADIYGAARFTCNIMSKIIVATARKPLVLCPQTIGPFSRWWAKRLAIMMMRYATFVVTRDDLSREFLEPHLKPEKLFEATDVAFRLPFDRKEIPETDEIKVGLNVSGLLFNGGYTQNNMFALKADYASLIRDLLSRFDKIENCVVHLIGHVNSHNHEVEDDYRIAQQLGAEFPRTIVAPRFESPSIAKTYIAQMDFFAGARMHACIAAFSSGVPTVPMAYSRKFQGLFGSLGYHHLADCRNQSSNEICSSIMSAFEDRQQLKADVLKSLENADDKLTSYEKIIEKSLLKSAA